MAARTKGASTALVLELEEEGEHQQEGNEANPRNMTFKVKAHRNNEEWVATTKTVTDPGRGRRSVPGN